MIVPLDMATLADVPVINTDTKQGCTSCGNYHPSVQLNGNLQVHLDAILPAAGTKIDISQDYGSQFQYNGPFGYGRSLGTNQLAQANGSPTWVSLTRGNGAIVSYQNDGFGNFIPQTPTLQNTLVSFTDSGNPYWKETTPQGDLTVYPYDVTGQISSIAYAQDAVGNRGRFSIPVGYCSRCKNLRAA